MLSDLLPKQAVHVYVANLCDARVNVQHYSSLLNEAERAQAARFISEALQTRYICTHGLLRQLLGFYLQIAPENIVFQFNDYKKPALANSHHSSLRFNISHSDDMAIFALTNGIEVGVDIEKYQQDPKLEVAERFFSAQENAQLNALVSAEQVQQFYHIWAKKEAVIKANGKGLGVPLSSFSVGLTIEPATLTVEQQTWTLYHLNVCTGYAAAVATSEPATVHYKTWDTI